MAEQVAAPAPTDAAPAHATGKGKGKLLIIIALAVVLLGGGGAAAWWLHSRPAQPAEHKAAPETPPLYLALDPPFVVNFESEQQVRFLQITVQLMSHDPKAIELLKANDPVVRNELLLLFANQKYAVLVTREGKEALRQEALASVRKVLESSGGTPEHLEAVYFTSFVMQ